MLLVQVHWIYKLNVCLKLKTNETNLDFLLSGIKYDLWLPLCIVPRCCLNL